MVAFVEQHQGDVDIGIARNGSQRRQQRLEQSTAPVPEATGARADDRQGHERLDTPRGRTQTVGEVRDRRDDAVCHPLRIEFLVARRSHQPDSSIVV
ncbi:hypothetical protein [Mycobacterium sp. C31M]